MNIAIALLLERSQAIENSIPIYGIHFTFHGTSRIYISIPHVYITSLQTTCKLFHDILEKEVGILLHVKVLDAGVSN